MQLFGVVVLLLQTSCMIQPLESSCIMWSPSENELVCCDVCSPGNRLVTKCGKDPATLCTPCVDNTYTNEPTAKTCSKCTECNGVLREKEACTSAHDTVCECIHSYHCGNVACTYCVKECGVGQEPTIDRSCQDCPAGTFNNKLNSHCIPWRTSCPEPDMYISTEGTAATDRVCTFNTNKDDGSKWVVIAMVMAIAFSCIVSLVAAYVYKNRMGKKATMETHTSLKPIISPRVDDCSFCFPQQEQGSTSSSSSSLHSVVFQEKLLLGGVPV